MLDLGEIYDTLVPQSSSEVSARKNAKFQNVGEWEKA